MNRIEYYIADFVNNTIPTIIIVLCIIALIKLIFWCCWYGNTKDIRDYIKNIDKNFAKHHDALQKQNEQIIENQKQIIELLENKNSKE